MLYNLSREQLEVLETEEGAYAVVMGYLKSERGKIPLTDFNKLVDTLGYAKLRKTELKEFGKKVKTDSTLNELYKKGFKREIKLDDVPDCVAKDGNLKEEDVFSQITNYLIDKEDNNARLRELRKLQREGTQTKLLMDKLKGYLQEELKGVPKAKYMKTPTPDPEKGDKSLVICFADWHVGFMSFNMDTGDYNFERLQTSVSEVVSETHKLIQDYGINHVYVIHLGDITEKVDMRNVNQAYDAQFPFAEQISKGTKLILETLEKISKMAHVTFAVCGGNHDRMSGSKDVVTNDSVSYIVLDMLFFIQDKLGQLPNVTLVDNRDYIYKFELDVMGNTVVGVHGDKENKNGKKIPKHIKDKPIDVLLTGHLHNFSVNQEDYHRLHIQLGSTIGENNYSKDNHFPTTSPSQSILVFTKGYTTPSIIPLMFDKEGKLY